MLGLYMVFKIGHRNYLHFFFFDLFLSVVFGIFNFLLDGSIYKSSELYLLS